MQYWNVTQEGTNIFFLQRQCTHFQGCDNRTNSVRNTLCSLWLWSLNNVDINPKAYNWTSEKRRTCQNHIGSVRQGTRNKKTLCPSLRKHLIAARGMFNLLSEPFKIISTWIITNPASISKCLFLRIVIIHHINIFAQWTSDHNMT